MIDRYALAEYRRMQVLTASPAKLVLLTFDVLSSSVATAARLGEEADWPGFQQQLKRADAALQELLGALDLARGGDIARNLYALYRFLRAQLVRAEARREPAILAGVQPIIDNLREGWRGLCESQP